MDPFTLTMAASALKAGGSLFGGYEGSVLGKLQSNLYSSNAQLYGTESDTALDDKQLALTGGAYNQTVIGKRVAQTVGAENAGYAARNLDPSSGSPLLVQMQSAAQGAVDKALANAQALLQGSNATGRAASLKNQQASSYFSAYGAAQKGESDLLGGIFGAGSAMLGAAGGFKLPTSSASAASKGIGGASFDPEAAWG